MQNDRQKARHYDMRRVSRWRVSDLSGREKDRKIDRQKDQKDRNTDIMMCVGYPDGGKPTCQVNRQKDRQTSMQNDRKIDRRACRMTDRKSDIMICVGYPDGG